MQVTFTISETHLEHFKNSKDVIIVDAINVEDSIYNLYRVTFQFEDWMSINMICQFFFHAGVHYGLDIEYSSYGTEPSR